MLLCGALLPLGPIVVGAKVTLPVTLVSYGVTVFAVRANAMVGPGIFAVAGSLPSAFIGWPCKGICCCTSVTLVEPPVSPRTYCDTSGTWPGCKGAVPCL